MCNAKSRLKHKGLALLLSLAMIVNLLPISAFAAEEVSEEISIDAAEEVSEEANTDTVEETDEAAEPAEDEVTAPEESQTAEGEDSGEETLPEETESVSTPEESQAEEGEDASEETPSEVTDVETSDEADENADAAETEEEDLSEPEDVQPEEAPAADGAEGETQEEETASEGTVYKDGTYTGTGTGYGGTMTVSVTISEGKIAKIENVSNSETASIWTTEKAAQLYNSIISAQSTTVDAISGATSSSDGVKAAVKDALSKAVYGFSGGTGTADDPYLISSVSGLTYLQTQVNNGTAYQEVYFKQTSDIDLSDVASWTPIGDSDHPFSGTYDGDGYTISNLKIGSESSPANVLYAGLFGYGTLYANYYNINLTNVAIYTSPSSTGYAGAIVAYLKSKGSSDPEQGSVLQNCSATGTISVNVESVVMAGGLVGMSNQFAAIANCEADVNVTVNSGSKNGTVGGLVGMVSIKALVMNNVSHGDASLTTSSTSYDNIGGMFGMVNGIVYNNFCDGNATATGADGATLKNPAGGFAGNVAAATYVNSCYYNSDVTGFCGSSSGNVDTETTGQKTASEEFVQLLHNNLSSSAIATMTSNVTTANITGCTDFAAMTSRVNNQFYDWVLSSGTAVLADTLWTTGDIDASIFASGSGTETDPYIIETADQLRAFAASLNDKIDYTNLYIALGADINVSASEWTPIGGSDYAFNGTFDGQNHTISGIQFGSEGSPKAMTSENPFIGLFGVLNGNAVVKDVKLTNVAIYATTEKISVYIGGIAGYMDSTDTSGNTGALIDGCSVSGTLSLTADPVEGSVGNEFVGGLVGMQYKGAIINSSAATTLSCIVNGEALAEAGGLVGLNNRGLVANCYSDSNVYGSGSRENGLEGMAVVSPLVAVQAGALVNCYGSGDTTTKEYSTYVGMVSGWVTGIGKSYSCWYDLDSTMYIGEDDVKQTVNPVEAIGTKVSSGVDDEGGSYTGGLVDAMTGYNAAGYSAIAEALNGTFSAFPIDITQYGLEATALKKWTYDETNSLVTFGTGNGSVTYVQPDCETVTPVEQTMQDGTWYGRNDDKTSVVKITVADGEITATEVISGATSGDAYDAAVEKAKYKAVYGDFSHYEAADASKFAGGSGTESDPYLIANETQLRYLATSINEDVNWSGKYFKQTADINVSSSEWLPIGWALQGEVNGAATQIGAYPFRGNYDGGDYTISGLKIGSAAEPADMMTAGLFGMTAGTLTDNTAPTADDQTVTLKNIHLKDVGIYASTRYELYAGALVGIGQYGIYVDNCSATGQLNVFTSESFDISGGLAGSVLRGSVTNSWTDVTITASTDSSHVYAGGVFGMTNRVTVINCYALGDVTGNSSNNNKVHIGGFTGQQGGVQINCYAAGNVISKKTTTDVGGMNGRNGGIAADYNCYFNSEATQKQGDTTNETNVAVGVNANNSSLVSAEGKTAAELASKDFAALLNSNKADVASLLADSGAVGSFLIGLLESGSTHLNYYQNNDLLEWVLSDGVVGFGTADDDSVYVLMNIPYSAFYNALGVSNSKYNYDAVSSATNKVGNYGKSGGGYHGDVETASIAEDETVTAVGGANGAEIQGVIWPVKTTQAALTALGGTKVTDDSSKVVATLGKGQTSSTTVVGYQTLMEEKEYSYYELGTAPDYYLNLTVSEEGTPTFSTLTGTATEKTGAEVAVTYGSNWGDVQLTLTGVNDASSCIINAVVITAKDSDGSETKVGFVLLNNVWSAADMAWKVAQTPGLDGKTISNITYYGSVKDSDNTDDSAPTYANYVYSYSLETAISPVYTGTIAAVFDSASQITLTGLPADAKNVQAKVYHTTGGKNAVYTYLTPLVVDKTDDDIDPTTVSVTDGKIAISPTQITVTNSAGETQTYGCPVDGTTYTIELSSDNWVLNKTSAIYHAGEFYVLMNIPYSAFYNALGVSNSKYNYDAVSSATNKVGNYGKSSGGYHGDVATAQSDGEGGYTAVGGANGAEIQGVIWPVKTTQAALTALGGTKVTDDSSKVVATLGQGKTSYTTVVGYQTLMEEKEYSYYDLGNTAPNYYLDLTVSEEGTPTFSTLTGTATETTGASAAVTYGSNWGDVQLGLTGVDDASSCIINAVVITAKDSDGSETKVGFVLLNNVWSAAQMAWKVAQTPGLDGKTITNITYYGSVKDSDTSDDSAPAYVNYVYSYSLETAISPVYTGTIAAAFDSSSQITVTGLPADAKNVQAKVYHTTGGRNAVVTYLTPLVVDLADDDIDPTTVTVTDGKIAISPTPVTVTNKAGESKTYGCPVDGTTYTIELSSDNWVLNKASAIYHAGEFYVLMNIPYSAFYNAVSVTNSSYDYDAVSSATNKVGNYGKSSGGYHGAVATASIAEDGTITAVGGANGAEIQGVIWPVKTTQAALTALGGTKVTDDSSKVVATLGQGKTSFTTVVGYQTLMEEEAYSYYDLGNTAPSYYLDLTVSDTTPTFSTLNGTATETTGASAAVTYGSNWGDVQLTLTGVDDASSCIINAVVVTAKDSDGSETKVGFVLLNNVWSATQMAWKVAQTPGLDGKTITNITYYGSVKDSDTSDDSVPAYANYVYSYSLETAISPVYTGTIAAAFDSSSQITVTGLPADAKNVQAKVYHTTGGRNAVVTYLTPLVVDPADDDIDPTTVTVTDGKIAISPTQITVTNSAGETQTYGCPVDGTTYTIELSSDNWVLNKASAIYHAGDFYVLMNIPYSAFYNVLGVTNSSYDYDAVSSATNKVGNYGKSSGGYHGAVATASIAEDGTVTAVGGDNGAKIQGVIWPVKTTQAALTALGGTKVTDSSSKVVATLGQGRTSSTTVVGYQTLMEEETYSYYDLGNTAPSYYLDLTVSEEGTPTFSTLNGTATETTGASAAVTYGSNWGDVQLGLTGVDDASSCIINAVVITAKDSDGSETKVGFVLLNNVWSAAQMAWKVAQTPGLDGKTITNITYYGSVKDSDTSDDSAPAYVNYVYSYSLETAISPVYTGTIAAVFDSASQITLTGLPADAKNVQAKVYHTTGGKNAVYTYLTPLVVDKTDDDIDPTTVSVTDGKIAISPTLVTVINNAGESKTYGSPVDGTTYTIELSSDNWVFNKISATYTENGGGSDEETSSVIATADPVVTLGDGVAASDQAAATAVAESVGLDTSNEATVTALQSAVNGIDAAEAAAELEKAKTELNPNNDQTVTLVRKIYLDVTVTGYDVENANKSVLLNIEPKYDLYATVSQITANDGELAEVDDTLLTLIEEGKAIQVNAAVTISVDLPSGFVGSTTTPVYVKHTKDSGKKYVYKADVTSANGTFTATFTNPHGFSTFELTTETASSITDEDGTTTYYDTLQEAVNAVTDGQTITVLKDGESASVSRVVKFTVAKGTGVSSYTINITGNYRNQSSDTDTYDIVATSSHSGSTGGSSSGGSGGGGSGSSSYAISISSMGNGTVKANHTSASKGAIVTLTVSPEDGYALDTLTVTDASGNTLTLTDKGDGTYTFTMPSSKVTVSASFKEASTTDADGTNPFTDVASAQYYYDAVLWAVENGVTTGTSATTFSPNASCTRAQMVTFLWRAAGSPAPTSDDNPFTDVNNSAYYYNAVLWAVEKGITVGTSATTFSPDATVTRGQTVTFLYRYADSPAVSGSNAFTDVSSNAYYADAVQWAVENEVTNGTSTTTFSPENDCTRAQIVTLLYRYIVK